MPEDDERELEAALARAGVTPPPGRMRGLLAAYKDLRPMLPLLRGPRDAAAEPAGVYSFDSITRDRGA